MAIKKVTLFIAMALWAMVVSFLSVSHALEITYTYDNLDRIATAVYSLDSKTVTLSYQYDASGNRTVFTVTQGSVGTIVIDPQPADVNTTAPWTLTGPGGVTGLGKKTLNNLPTGEYTLTWEDIADWTKPSPSKKTLVAGGNVTFNEPYTVIPQTGSLTVTITPQGAIDAGAQWRRTGTATWFDGGSTETAIPVNSYTVEFKAVTGWTTPGNQTVTIVKDQTATGTGTYERLTSAVIQVTPGSLNFGYVPLGSTKDLTLTVTNAGGETLTGSATTAAPFSIFSGGIYSNIAPGKEHVVTIRYQPTSPGKHTDTVGFTGANGATIPVTGKTEKSLGLPWLQLLLGE